MSEEPTRHFKDREVDPDGPQPPGFLSGKEAMSDLIAGKRVLLDIDADSEPVAVQAVPLDSGVLNAAEVARDLRRLAERIDPEDQALNLVRKHLVSLAECVENDPPLVHEACGQTFLG